MGTICAPQAATSPRPDDNDESFLRIVSSEGIAIRNPDRDRGPLSWIRRRRQQQDIYIPFEDVIAVRIADVCETSGRLWRKSRNKTNRLIIDYVVRDRVTKVWRKQSASVHHDSRDVISEWSAVIGQEVEKKVGAERPRNLLVFVNPFGGKGRAEKICGQRVRPLLTSAGVEHTVVVTRRANHAFDHLQQLTEDELLSYDGIVSVGGDGTFSELFTGLLLRSETIAPPKVRVGVVPAGSTNAVALSSHGTTDVETAVLHIVLGDRRNVDLVSVTALDEDGKEHFQKFSMTMISYGYFGDLLKRSEKFRWLGPKRYHVSGFQTFFKNRGYAGVVTFKSNSPSDPKAIETICMHNCPTCDNHGEDENSYSKEHVVDVKFISVVAACTSCACHHAPKGVSPSAHLGDGNLDLILVRKTSRFNHLCYLYRLSHPTLRRSPFHLPFVQVYRVKGFHFRPSRNPATKTSTWNCDGELLNSTEIRARVHCQILPVFTRGIEH